VPGSGRGALRRQGNCSGECDEEPVRPEVTFTAHLDCAGIRLPGSLPGRGGRFLQELAPGHGGGWLRLYRWIDGVPADRADPGLAVRIGGLAGRLPALARPAAGGAGPWYDTVPGPATWDQLADAARGQGAGGGQAVAGHAGLLSGLADLVPPWRGTGWSPATGTCTPATCWPGPVASWPCPTGTMQGRPARTVALPGC
jgi:hypothetical protein